MRLNILINNTKKFFSVLLIRMKFTKKIYIFLRDYYIHIIIISTLITLIGFGLAILAESENQKLESLENSFKTDGIDDRMQILEIIRKKITITEYGFTGLILLFVGFLVTSTLQTYILFHTRKNPLKKIIKNIEKN
jgi:hypothetical protein